MKALLATFALLLCFAPLAKASTDVISYSKFVCKQIDLKHGEAARTFVLKKIGDVAINEGVEYKYQFLLFNGIDRAPEIATVVKVTTEDVMFNFENKARGISGMIFLDEYDQTSLTIDGQDLRFACE
jgi:hypothetical protein